MRFALVELWSSLWAARARENETHSRFLQLLTCAFYYQLLTRFLQSPTSPPTNIKRGSTTFLTSHVPDVTVAAVGSRKLLAAQIAISDSITVPDFTAAESLQASITAVPPTALVVQLKAAGLDDVSGVLVVVSDDIFLCPVVPATAEPLAKTVPTPVVFIAPRRRGCATWIPQRRGCVP